MKKTALFTSLFALTCLASGQAFAGSVDPVNPVLPPVTGGLSDFNCQLGDVLDENDNPVPVDPDSAHQFNTGVAIGQNIVKSAWLSTDQDSSSIDEFITESINRTALVMGMGLSGLEPQNGFDQALGCRFIGTVQGVALQVAIVLTETISSCASDGDYWSEFAAGLFCEFTQLAGSLQFVEAIHGVEGNICAEAFQASCVGAFDDNARAYTSENVDDCAQYVDPADPVYECHRDNLCIYRAVTP